MHVDDLILNVGQFLDEDTNVMIGSVEVNMLSDNMPINLENLTAVVDFNFHLYNMNYFSDTDQLPIITDELSEEEAYLINTLNDTQAFFIHDHLVMTISDFNWSENYYSLENKMLILTKFIHYCKYNNYDYLALMVGKEAEKKLEDTNVTEFPKVKQYEALGFERINIHQTPVMVKNLNEK